MLGFVVDSSLTDAVKPLTLELILQLSNPDASNFQRCLARRR